MRLSLNSESSPTLAQDQALPTLPLALDFETATPALVAALGLEQAEPRLCGIHVLAYKPGRRCLIEYQIETIAEDGRRTRISVLGKIRSKRFGNGGYRQLQAIWAAGFDDRSADRISVPESLGTVPTLRMWLQRKVTGTLATRLIRPDRVDLAGRIAVAAHKLHIAPLVPERRHRMDDELTILERCLAETANMYPESAAAIVRLLDDAIRLGTRLPSPTWCPSHRDFYSDQVIVSGDRLFLIDFDLFCEADPALDIGNFVGHVTEQAVRLLGTPQALERFEHELEDQYVCKAGEHVRWAVRVYAALSLLRHVYLCTRTAERAPFLPALVAAARERVGRTAADGGHA